jgi:TonB family protein
MECDMTGLSDTLYDRTESGVPLIPVYNSFREDARGSWFTRHSVTVLFCFLSLLVAVLFSIDWDIYLDEARNRTLDAIDVTVIDLGDFVQLSRVRPGRYVEIDEVFGNQYIKKEAQEYDPDRDMVDPRIGTAVIPATVNSTMPVDLNPELEPEYTTQARSAGVEGFVTLEVVISDDGRVLRARPVGKKLGHGLDESAARCWQRKNFKPSVNSDGEPITVKMYFRVKFTLI